MKTLYYLSQLSAYQIRPKLHSTLVDVVRLPHEKRKITRKQLNEDAEEDRDK